MPYQYPGESVVAKIFVCVGHESGCALCMKATSQVALYVNDTAKLDGVVFYAAGELSFFSFDTAIQPDNPHPISHTDIGKCIANGTFVLLGKMPDTFPARLISAIKASVTMKPVRKKHWLERL